jgi:hypothetical protein
VNPPIEGIYVPQHFDPTVVESLPAWADLIDMPEPGAVSTESALAETPQEGESMMMKALKAGVIVNEILPTDDVVRYGLVVAAQGYSHNPAVGAAILGLATFATEGSAVLASAKWIAEDRIRPVIDTAREKIDSFKETLDRLLPRVRPGRFVPNIPKDPEVGGTLPITVQAAVALNLGNVILLEAKQRRDPTRTTEQNRRQGLQGAALVAGYLAVEGALISTGFGHVTNPVYLTSAALGIAGLQYGVHKLQKKIKGEPQS